MQEKISVGLILVICLILIFLVFILGVEFGKVNTLHKHAMYDSLK